MKFRSVVVLRDFKANGHERAEGEVLSLPLPQAAHLVFKKRARWATDSEAVPEPQPMPPTPEPPAPTAPEPEPEPAASVDVVQPDSAQPMMLEDIGRHPSFDDDASEPEGLPKAFPSRRCRKKAE